ncbi:MAG: alpha/beta fold hydrolase [Acidobacteria bacterium]|nr:alpha/beta fold hydrolase [Acidobacteriota bacterium]
MVIGIAGRQVGIDVRGGGVPLLLIHGFPLHKGMFEPQLEGLSTVAKVITFDVPGVGESAPGPLSMDDIADVAAAVLTDQGIEKAVIGGVSMGGYAAFSFARRDPDRLLGLILADTRAVGDSETGKEGRAKMARLVEEEGVSAAVGRMIPGWFGHSTLEHRPEVVRQARAIAEAAPPEAVLLMLQALADRPDSTPTLGEIQVPTLVISGQEDPLIPASEMGGWAALIPDARHVVIPRTGHLPNLEDPKAFNRAVAGFLAETLSGPISLT